MLARQTLPGTATLHLPNSGSGGVGSLTLRNSRSGASVSIANLQVHACCKVAADFAWQPLITPLDPAESATSIAAGGRCVRMRRN